MKARRLDRTRPYATVYGERDYRYQQDGDLFAPMARGLFPPTSMQRWSRMTKLPRRSIWCHARTMRRQRPMTKPCCAHYVRYIRSSIFTELLKRTFGPRCR